MCTTNESTEVPYIIAGLCCLKCGHHVALINNKGTCSCGETYEVDQPLIQQEPVYERLPVTVRGEKPPHDYSNLRKVYVGNKAVGLVHVLPLTNQALAFSTDWGKTWWKGKGDGTIQEAVNGLLHQLGYTHPY